MEPGYRLPDLKYRSPEIVARLDESRRNGQTVRLLIEGHLTDDVEILELESTAFTNPRGLEDRVTQTVVARLETETLVIAVDAISAVILEYPTAH